MADTETIYLWPDNSWEWDHEIDDLDWYIASGGKGEDFATYEVPTELDAEDIDELIELKALPGMSTPKAERIENQGLITLPTDSIIVLQFPMSETPFITHLDGKMIINCDNMSIEILKGK